MNLPLNINELIDVAAARFMQAGLANPKLDASLLLAHVLGIPRVRLVLEQEREITPSQAAEFEKYVTRREKSEPIAYITGKKEFWSLDFIVTRDTLIPRPDSETLVEAALKRAENIAQALEATQSLTDIGILDIGTGTGCLLIAILKSFPQAHGVGVDISEPALRVARMNSENHGTGKRVQFIKSNWCDEVNGTFDLIISNPPYIAQGDAAHLMKDVAAYEPASALFSGEDGMDSYREISRCLQAKLNPGGYALLEVGQGQAEHVARMLEEQGFAIDEIRNDLSGIPRCVVARKKN